MKKILSIDDSAQLRSIVRGAVEVLGYEFLEAVDGESGLDVIAEHLNEIELVLLDVNMPGMLGFEVLKRIKDEDATQHLRVIMVTTESESQAIIGSIKTGAANYVTKPFDQEELMMKMVETIGMESA